VTNSLVMMKFAFIIIFTRSPFSKWLPTKSSNCQWCPIPRYQFSLQSENIEILPILSATILKMAAIRSRFLWVRIFYQTYLIYMPSLLEIPSAVSDISEVKYFDIQNRQNFNVLWLQWKLISRVILKWRIDW
jgi:hypothetical protein